jgi:hypothetical protein
MVVISLVISLNLIACKTEIRNPSDTDVSFAAEALPEGILGDTEMEYFSAEETNSTVFENNELVVFTISATGSLSYTNEAEEFFEIDDFYDVVGTDYNWIEADNDNLRYEMILSKAKIVRINLYNEGGEAPLGQFLPVSDSNDTVEEQNVVQETTQTEELDPNNLPEKVIGEFDMLFTEEKAGTIYSNSDKRTCIFGEDGSLTVINPSDGGALRYNDFVLINNQYVWTDAPNGINYELSIKDGEIDLLYIRLFDSTPVGVFKVLSTIEA